MLRNLDSPVRKRKVPQEIVYRIREQILSGALARGSKLPSEQELTENLNVSRQTLREALRFMEAHPDAGALGVRMLNPTAGEDGVVEAVVDMMRAAGGKPCPPVFLGVGIGGTMDRAALLSKKAFFHGKESRRMLDAVNALGIGPGGLGGHPTALGVAVLSEPTHIAGLPVALTVNCWAERKATIVFERGEI